MSIAWANILPMGIGGAGSTKLRPSTKLWPVTKLRPASIGAYGIPTTYRALSKTYIGFVRGITMFDTSIIDTSESRRREQLEQTRTSTLATVCERLVTFFEHIPVDAVYVTGSLSRPHEYRPGSDIDIAVRGLPSNMYFTVLAAVQELLETGHVDLIELERCSFRESIEEMGIRVR